MISYFDKCVLVYPVSSPTGNWLYFYGFSLLSLPVLQWDVQDFHVHKTLLGLFEGTEFEIGVKLIHWNHCRHNHFRPNHCRHKHFRHIPLTKITSLDIKPQLLPLMCFKTYEVTVTITQLGVNIHTKPYWKSEFSWKALFQWVFL